MTRRKAVGSLVAITLVNFFFPIGVLSTKLSSSTCQSNAFSVDVMYCLTIVLFSVSAVITRLRDTFDEESDTDVRARGIRILAKCDAGYDGSRLNTGSGDEDKARISSLDNSAMVRIPNVDLCSVREGYVTRSRNQVKGIETSNTIDHNRCADVRCCALR